MTSFTENVINIIRMIPCGKVMTYGQIAAYAGNIRGARQVARILHSMSDKYLLPWHRVINSQGKISLTGELHFIQKDMLEKENIKFDNSNKVDLKIYLFTIE